MEMNKRKGIMSFLLLSLILTLLLSSISMVLGQDGDAVPKGAYPDTMIIFLHETETTVVPMIEADQMQGWLWWLNPENTELAEASPDVELIESFGLYNEFFVNPLETTGDWNPFSIKAVREALNWLIDREYIVNELWFGRGVPKTTIFKAIGPDYARVADYMNQLEAEYEYDFDKAKIAIFTALEDAGAELVDGKWYYEGDPVKAKLLIRIEDERRPTGDYLASQLELLGFTVERNYKPSRDAYSYYGALSPTAAGDWHIYTSGWISLAMVAYEDDLVWFMYAEDNAPLYGVWAASPLLVDAYTTLNNGEYLSASHRNELVKTCTDLSLEDGGHIMYMDQLVSFPISADLGPMVYDLYGADQSLWGLRTMRYPEAGETIKLGARAIFVEGFNPAAGFSWLYDVYVQYLIEDTSVWPHPHTGRYIPLRAEEFDVDTAGPDGTLSVPGDALKYDVTAQAFQAVGPGVTATSKVTFNYSMGTWHHGESIVPEDILAQVAQRYKLVTPGTNLYDAVAATPKRTVFTNNLKGIKFVDDNIVEVYIDYWHVDDTYISWYADPWPQVPWELWALQNELVSNQLAAWSIDYADIWDVDMMDLTKGTSIDLLYDGDEGVTSSGYLELSAANYIPPELVGRVTVAEAEARWTALGTFYTTYDHWYASSGPYMFDNADTTALQITMNSYSGYPYYADRYNNMLTVAVPDVAATDIPTEVVPGLAATFEFTVTVAGTPYDKAEMNYLLMDPLGVLVLSGTATNLGTGVFTVDLTPQQTAGLVAGSYSFTTITTGEEAAIPTTEETAFTVVPELAYFQTQIAALQTQLSSVQTSVATLQQTTEDLNTALEAAQSMQNVLLGVAVVSMILGVGAIAVALRRP